MENLKTNKFSEDNENILFNSLKKFTISKKDVENLSENSQNITLYYSISNAKTLKYYLKYTNLENINSFSFDDFIQILSYNFLLFPLWYLGDL